MNLHEIDGRTLVGDAVTAEDVPPLVAAGVRTVVDLRAHGEPRPSGLAPWEESELVRRAGMTYCHVPVEPPLLHDDLGHAIRGLVSSARPRILLHCSSGRRAGVFGLLALACSQRLTVEDCLRRGRAIGLDFGGMPRLTAFLRAYVDRYARREVPIARDYEV